MSECKHKNLSSTCACLDCGAFPQRLDTMASVWLHKHRHGVDTTETYDELRSLLAAVRDFGRDAGISVAVADLQTRAALEWRAGNASNATHDVLRQAAENIAKRASADACCNAAHEWDGAPQGDGAITCMKCGTRTA